MSTCQGAAGSSSSGRYARSEARGAPSSELHEKGRTVNEFVVEEVLRNVYGMPGLFRTPPVPPAAMSGAGAAILRYLNDTDTGIAAGIDRVLDTAEDLHRRRTRH